jgi:1-acyl-sn-glycerol-3-phosphate acyltransferase
MPLPPRWIRRVLLAPLATVLALALLATMPVWIVVTAMISPFGSGRLRPLRVTWLVTVYLCLEAAALVAMFGLWLASGFGWKVRSPGFQRAHYVLTGWFLRALFAQARWVLRLSVAVVGIDPDVAAPGRPELVFSRHAGPGDSLIVVHALVNWYAREPRIVLKDTLQWDPGIDVLLNRLPSRFITPHELNRPGLSVEDQIAALATGLDSNDVFVIFPEGGNFSPSRRIRAIERLHRLGLHEMARRAEQWRHVMAPRPGGALAALEAAPEAGVIWVAHAGLDKLRTIGDIWRGLPLDSSITMRWWSVPASEVPAGRDKRIEWLYDWWARIDAWIEEQHTSVTPAKTVGGNGTPVG